MSEENQAESGKEARNAPNLSLMNTLMAADRTLMAWIRTAFTMLTFGFTLYKILQAMQQTGTALPQENTPRNAGVTLIVLALIALIVGAIGYWRTVRQLETFYEKKLPHSPSLLMALFTALVGLFLLFVVLTRMF